MSYVVNMHPAILVGPIASLPSPSSLATGTLYRATDADSLYVVQVDPVTHQRGWYVTDAGDSSAPPPPPSELAPKVETAVEWTETQTFDKPPLLPLPVLGAHGATKGYVDAGDAASAASAASAAASAALSATAAGVAAASSGGVIRTTLALRPDPSLYPGSLHYGTDRPFAQAWSLAHAGRWHALQPEANAVSFGADPAGATDSLGAFEACAEWAWQNKVDMVIPEGIYHVSDTWKLTRPIKIRGAGAGSNSPLTVLKWPAGHTGMYLDNGSQGCEISGLGFQCYGWTPAWSAGTAYQVGQIVAPTEGVFANARVDAWIDSLMNDFSHPVRWAGHVFRCVAVDAAVNGGRSGASEPPFADYEQLEQEGATFADGGVTWKACRADAVRMGSVARVRDCYFTVWDGYAFACITVGDYAHPAANDNANDCLVMDCWVQILRGGAAYLHGPDSNAVSFRRVIATDVYGIAFFDDAFLGNKFQDCHVENCYRGYVSLGLAGQSDFAFCYGEMDSVNAIGGYSWTLGGLVAGANLVPGGNYMIPGRASPWQFYNPPRKLLGLSPSGKPQGYGGARFYAGVNNGRANAFAVESTGGEVIPGSNAGADTLEPAGSIMPFHYVGAGLWRWDIAYSDGWVFFMMSDTRATAYKPGRMIFAQGLYFGSQFLHTNYGFAATGNAWNRGDALWSWLGKQGLATSHFGHVGLINTATGATVADPSTGAAGIVHPIGKVGGRRTLTLAGSGLALTETHVDFVCDKLVLAGAPAGPFTLTLPVADANAHEGVYDRWIYNTTAQPVTVKTAAQSGGVVLSPGRACRVLCDGTRVLREAAEIDPTV